MAKASKRLKKALELNKQLQNAHKVVGKVALKLSGAKMSLTQDERREYDKLTDSVENTNG